jgi:two-component system CheB/CheR fusion protein
MALLDKVSYLSQLKVGEVPFQMGPEDLGAIAREAVERARAASEKAGVRLTLEAERPAPVRGDAKHLGRVVDALLDNAIRFSPGGETVRVATGTSDTGSHLTVSDSGPGVDSELLPRLFEDFTVADVDHHTTGHGLSLATARLIAEQHAGTLELEPRAGEAGATFRLLLPAGDGGSPRN